MGRTTALRGLTPEHYKTLSTDSAISDEVIEGRGYASLNSSAAQLQDYGAAQLPSDGLWLPGWTVTGERTSGQFRPDSPREIDGRVLKYETPHGATNYLDVHPLILDRVRNTTDPLFIIEGVKKADSIISAGQMALALSGVWNWRGRVENGEATRVLPDFDEIPWRGRVVVIWFDSDIRDNDNVALAHRRLSDVIRRRGGLPHTVDWGKLTSAG